MRYVQRDQAGQVIAFYPTEQKGVAEEALAEDDPEIAAFLFRAAHQASALQAVSAAAEEARLGFITPGAGKAMAYLQKAHEAAAFVADPNPSAEAYPLIFAEIGITAASAAEVAAIIIGKHRQFQAIEAQITRTELGTRQAIRAATSPEEIAAILAGLAWPKP